MANTRWESAIISKGAVYAAGTTNFKSKLGSAATSLPTGVIKAGVGFGFEAGDAKLFAAGTYIGSGAATAAIVSTGLTTVHKVLMNLYDSAYSGATHNSAGFCQPQHATGTPGSFYPTVVYIAPGAAVNYTLGVGAAATWAWLAIGA